MPFWIELDRSLAGARSDTGFSNPMAVDALLDRWEMKTEINRDTARRMLDNIASGRVKAMGEKIDPEPPRKPRP